MGNVSRAVSARLGALAGQDRGSAVLAGRLLEIADRYLPLAYSGGEFAFTLRGAPGPDGGWQVHRAGASVRYGGIVALGLSCALRRPSSVRCWPGRPVRTWSVTWPSRWTG